MTRSHAGVHPDSSRGTGSTRGEDAVQRRGGLRRDRHLRRAQILVELLHARGAQDDAGHPGTPRRPRQRELRAHLLTLQYRTLELARFPVLIDFAGVDGAGKGSTVNMLNTWMDPRFLRSIGYQAPSLRSASHELKSQPKKLLIVNVMSSSSDSSSASMKPVAVV